jgi:hypothetical protein
MEINRFKFVTYDKLMTVFNASMFRHYEIWFKEPETHDIRQLFMIYEKFKDKSPSEYLYN